MNADRKILSETEERHNYPATHIPGCSEHMLAGSFSVTTRTVYSDGYLYIHTSGPFCQECGRKRA